MLFLSNILQRKKLCSLQAFTSPPGFRKQKETLHESVGIDHNADAMFQIMDSQPRNLLLRDHEIERWPTMHMHLHDTGDAARLVWRLKHRCILPSWQHNRPADVETFSADTK